MEKLQQLYKEKMIEHQKDPKNFGKLADSTHQAEHCNPLCGDTVQVEVKINQNHLDQVMFNGSVCGVCKASTSMMTELVQHKDIESIRRDYDYLQQVVDPEQQIEIEGDEKDSNLNLKIFAALRKSPTRTKCATLGWDALIEAISQPE